MGGTTGKMSSAARAGPVCGSAPVSSPKSGSPSSSSSSTCSVAPSGDGARKPVRYQRDGFSLRTSRAMSESLRARSNQVTPQLVDDAAAHRHGAHRNRRGGRCVTGHKTLSFRPRYLLLQIWIAGKSCDADCNRLGRLSNRYWQHRRSGVPGRMVSAGPPFALMARPLPVVSLLRRFNCLFQQSGAILIRYIAEVGKMLNCGPQPHLELSCHR